VVSKCDVGTLRRRSSASFCFRLVGIAGLVGLLGSIACGTSSNHFDGSVYRDDKLGFKVPAIPAEWRRLDVSDASLAFRDDTHDATILLNGRCGRRDDDTPLLALTQHLILGTTERAVESQQTIPFDGREALHTVMRAKLDGVVMSYDIYVLKKDSCVYDFVYVASPDRFAEGAPAFERFVMGVHTVPAAGG
jgi:hypothetical protein